jgi:hypothetical protein
MVIVDAATTPPLAPVYVYDPTADNWSAASPMPLPRSAAPTLLLTSGRVLVPGGYQTAVAHVYDPIADVWTVCYPLGMPRWAPAGVALPDGRALVTGGFTTTSIDDRRRPVTTAELFSPDTLGWAPTGAMSDNRSHLTATLLQSGMVLAAGGFFTEGSDSRASCELYDPTTGAWQRTASMAESCGDHLAVRLDDGRVLVVGGTRATAEVFTS